VADDLEITDAAQDAVEPDTAPDTETTNEAPPWGEDFDAQRAWNTIQNLRTREKELEKAAKEYERLTSDPDAYYEHGTRQGWVELDDDPEQEPEAESTDDPTARDVAELKAWKEQQDQERALNAFNSDLDRLAGDAEVELTPAQRKLIMVESLNNGWNQEATQKAFESLKSDLDAYEQRVIERYRNSKKAPSPPRAGKQGEAEFDPTDRDERQKRMEAIIASAAED
jgi:hypothetical protein